LLESNPTPLRNKRDIKYLADRRAAWQIDCVPLSPRSKDKQSGSVAMILRFVLAGVNFTLSQQQSLALTTGTITANPFGTFSALLSTDGNWEGGSAAGGIAVGPVGRTFSFTLSRPVSDVEALALFRSGDPLPSIHQWC
jgi:hypothetical protein